MAGNPDVAIGMLNRRFLTDHPSDAARRIEEMTAADAVAALSTVPATVLVPVWRWLAPQVAAHLMRRLPDESARVLLSELNPNDALRVLGLVDDDERERYLELLDRQIAQELRRLLVYPENTAGRLMDTRVPWFRGDASVAETIGILRQSRVKTSRSIFIMNEHRVLAGRVAMQELVVAEPEAKLSDLAQPITATVGPLAPQEEVVEALERYRLADLPIVDLDGALVGIVYHADLMRAMQADATVDIQTMVGASRDERALSRPLFAVRKRLPWLQINLLTAFMAAAVVGLFEDTIAKFTALAVLLPVVAGQSGNAGAQALAVTMRGLALREITARSWLPVTSKEVMVGFINGTAVAVTCGLGVLVWSGSFGLMLVIAMSMVLAMVAAGFAGAIVPVTLTRLGQDPAQSSSIILTTVTDIAGFFSFLGIATLLASLL